MQTSSSVHAALTVTATALLLKVKKKVKMRLQVNSHRNTLIWIHQQKWQIDLLLKCWNTLIWIHQQKWQIELLKYGNTISLIDAKHKTTRYELPLFFVSFTSVTSIVNRHGKGGSKMGNMAWHQRKRTNSWLNCGLVHGHHLEKRMKILGSATKNQYGTSNIQRCGRITHVFSSSYQQHGFPYHMYQHDVQWM